MGVENSSEEMEEQARAEVWQNYVNRVRQEIGEVTPQQMEELIWGEHGAMTEKDRLFQQIRESKNPSTMDKEKYASLERKVPALLEIYDKMPKGIK